MKSRLKNDLSEYMQKLGISKIRIRVVHAKRIISHVFSCIFFFLKKNFIQRGVSNLLLYEFSCILKFSIQENGNFSTFFFMNMKKLVSILVMHILS